jgi:hypothetical protein
MDHTIGQRIPDFLLIAVIPVGRKLRQHHAVISGKTRRIPPIVPW